jgi:hypothetical protein
VYIAGSMKNRDGILSVSKAVLAAGYDIFNDWISPGPETDENWREFAKAQGQTFIEALYGAHAQNVLNFDKTHLDASDAFVLVYPAGKSGHTELGYMHGKAAPAFVLIDGEPERWDVMLGLSTRVVDKVEDLIAHLRIAVPQ